MTRWPGAPEAGRRKAQLKAGNVVSCESLFNVSNGLGPGVSTGAPQAK